MPAFVDTNLLVYYYDRSDMEKSDQAVGVVDRLPDFVVSAQVLGELFVTLVRKLKGIPRGHVEEIVRTVAADRRVIQIDAHLVDRALTLQETYPISYWDALIVCAAALAGCDRIYTEDMADGDRILGVEIVNPFRGL